MARLEDSGSKGLPKSPAPPRRGANPWSLSETARKPEQQRESISLDLLAEMMNKVPAQNAHAEAVAPPQAAPKRARSGLIPLVAIGFAVLIVLRIFFQVRKDGEWVGIIGPLVVIAFIAHGLWRARQRREEKKSRLQ